MAQSEKKPNAIELEERLDKVEDMLALGVAPGRIERTIAKDYAISTRQARRYISQVYARWRHQTIEDAPNRREKIIHMAERFYGKCLAEKQYSAANGALAILARMSGAFAQHDPAHDARMAALGAPPEDPTLGLVWAQRCMLTALHEVVCNPSIDPERRLRWIAELGGKLGMTHAKALLESKLDQVSDRVLGTGERNETELESATGISFPQNRRARRGNA